MSRDLMSPVDKYRNDPHFNRLVDMLEHFIHDAQFSPSELREACIFACINYEMKHVREIRIDPKIEQSLNILDNFIRQKPQRR